MRTLHLMTQEGQPYGSENRCCEVCGLMLAWRPDEFWDSHAYTDVPDFYRDVQVNGHKDVQTCN